MNSISSNPSDREAIRRLLAESAVAETPELSDALADLRAEGGASAPAPNPELEAFFTAGVAPLRKPSRRRGYLLGGAIIAAMAAGTTGVAATNGGFWVTAEDSHEAPAPVNYEQVPAPAPNPAIPDPADVPPAVPADPVEDVPEPEEPVKEIPAPEEPAPAPEQPVSGIMPEEESWIGGAGGWTSERPGQGWELNHGTEKTRGWEKNQDWPGQAAQQNKDNKNQKGNNKDDDGRHGRQNTGKPDANRGGPPHGRGYGSD